MAGDRDGLIVLDHGAGGGMSRELVVDLIATGLGEVYVGEWQDSTLLAVEPGTIALTTDSFVVDPPFFGGGDIGKLAVTGTVNDLAVCGARPLYLTLAMIIEEGFPLADLATIVASVRACAEEAGVRIAAGDTKVVRKGEADRIFLNTAGIGVLDRPARPDSRAIVPGDQLIVTGYLGDHSIHLLSLRAGLGFESRVPSDCAVLSGVIGELLDAFGPDVHAMRDITRGGLGTVLNEFAADCGYGLHIDGGALPVRPETAMAADMLGVDVLYLANEGNLCLAVAPRAAAGVVDLLRRHRYTAQARVVGTVVTGGGVTGGGVLMDLPGGGRRDVELLYGAQLPRLC